MENNLARQMIEEYHKEKKLQVTRNIKGMTNISSDTLGAHNLLHMVNYIVEH